MHANNRANNIKSRSDICYPIPDCLANCVFECLAAGCHLPNLCTEQSHPVDVRCLTKHVLFAHVDDAFESEKSTNGRNCHAVLACPRLCDDPPLPHPLGNEDLPNSIVYLVCTRVAEILSFQIDLSAAQ